MFTQNKNCITKYIRLVALVCLLSIQNVYSNELQLTEIEKSWLSDHQVINIGVDPDWSPYEYLDSQGQYRGVIADYMQLVANKLDIEFQIKETETWASYVNGDSETDVDLVTAIQASPERGKKYLFTLPYFSIPTVFITQNKVDSIYTKNDLKEKRVGIVDGYYYVEWLKDNYQNTHLVKFKNNEEGIQAVSDGNVDAFIVNRLTAINKINKLKLTNLRLNTETGFTWELSIGVRKDLAAFVPILEKALASISHREHDSILNKWMSVSIQQVAQSNALKSISSPPLKEIVLYSLLITLCFCGAAAFLSKKYSSISDLYSAPTFRLFISLSIVTILTAVIYMTWISASKEEFNTKTRYAEALASLLDTTRESIEFYIEDGLNELKVYANEPLLSSIFKLKEKEATRSKENEIWLRNHHLFRNQVYSLYKFSRNWSVSLYDLNLDPIFQNSDKIDHLKDFFHKNRLQNVPFFIPPVLNPKNNELIMYYVSPIFDRSGNINAYLVAEENPALFFTNIVSKARIGETGETYIIDLNGTLLTNTRFEDTVRGLKLTKKNVSIPGNTKIAFPIDTENLTLAAYSVINRIPRTDVSSYMDYRGVKVLGAWSTMDKYSIGLITEIDEEEALEGYNISRKTKITLIVVTLFLTLNLMAFSSWVGVRATRSLLKSEKELEQKIISRTNELIEKEKNISVLLEASPEPLIVINEHFLITKVNDQAEKTFKFDKDELVGKDINVLMPERFKASHVKNMQDYLGYPRRLVMGLNKEQFALTKNGDEIPVEITLNPVEIEGKIHVACLIRDITIQKRQSKQIVAAKEAAEKANTAKDNFLATMSHEIRTPLNGIIGNADILSHTNTSAEHQVLINGIMDSANSLITIINDILDYSKIEAGKIELENIDLSLVDVIESSITIIANSKINKNVYVHSYVDPKIPSILLGDPTRLRQVLLNLVNNSFKFTKQGEIFIKAVLCKEDENMAHFRISVSDTGIGISEKAKTNLFEAFTQEEASTTRNYGGTGLGLSICKKLIEAMGGKIDFKSQKGSGSEFFIELSLNKKRRQILGDKKYNLIGLSTILLSNNDTESFVCEQYLIGANASVLTVKNTEDYYKLLKSKNDNTDSLITVIIGENISPREFLQIVQKSKYKNKVEFVKLVNGKRIKPRLHNDSYVEIDTNPMLKSAFLQGIAIASGRISPEVFYDEKIDFTPLTKNKSMSIEDAINNNCLILFAEDNAINRDVISRQINGLGLACVTVEDGLKALEEWQTGKYSLVLTDCHMPNMDGYELARRIRKSEHGSNTKIIAITANALQGEAVRCFEAGMDDYISKPVTMKDLYNKLYNWIPYLLEQKNSQNDSQNYKKSKSLSITSILDISILKEAFGDDNEAIQDTLRDYLVDTFLLVKKMKAAHEKQSIDEIRKIAHQLKSSARIVGANKLADLFTIIEKAGTDHLPDVIEEQIKNVDGFLSEVETRIMKYTDKA